MTLSLILAEGVLEDDILGDDAKILLRLNYRILMFLYIRDKESKCKYNNHNDKQYNHHPTNQI